LKYALPVVINETIWGLAVSANTAIMGRLGASVLAANSVAQVTRQLATVVTFGLASTAAIYLGKIIGEQKLDEARAYAKRFNVLSVLIGIAGGLLIVIAAPFIIQMMGLGEEASRHLRFMMWVMSYFVIGQAFNTTIIVGILRSGGDTKFGVIADTLSMWTGSILLAFLAAFVFQAPVWLVYMLLMSDELIKIPLSAWRFKKEIWLKNVTRELA